MHADCGPQQVGEVGFKETFSWQIGSTWETLHNHVLLQLDKSTMYKLKWMRLAPTMCGSLLTTSKSSHLKGILTLKYCFLHCHTDYRCQHVTCSWYPRAFAATPSVNGVCTELCRPVYRTARLSLSVLHFWDSVYPIVQQLGQQFKQLIQKISKKSFCISKRKWQVCQDGQFWYPVFRLVSLGSVIWTLCTHSELLASESWVFQAVLCDQQSKQSTSPKNF